MKLKDLTQDQVSKVNRVISIVWDNIAYDACEIPGRMTNKVAIELCLDANRPSSFAGQDGKEVEELLQSVEDGWGKILTFFSKRNSLV